ncbi:MAG TPA: UDP-glucose 4-epimerase GalE [Burkholderiales bacterium]|nr:UDP-glucose 4-epimerase GalE [Burkholderiales bacterium]
MKSTILVTGGAGYIGSHTCKALAQAGYRPVTLDNLSRGHRWAVKWGPLVEGDLAHVEVIERAIRQFKVDAVMHFAGFAHVGESMAEPGKYFRNNAVNSFNLLEAMQACGVTRIVFSSTCAVYGVPQALPIVEEQPLQPVNPYGESKLCTERALHWYGAAHGFNWIALRYFNAAGADLDGEIGEDHHPETHLIPLAILSALKEREALDVYGTDYPTPDGTAIRDYIHVTDLAQAHVRALEYLLAGGASLPLNLGTGQGYSVREVVRAVEDLTGYLVPTRSALRRPGDPPALVAAAGRAREVLGWQPRHSDLQTIVDTAWAWHSARSAPVLRAVAVG